MHDWEFIPEYTNLYGVTKDGRVWSIYSKKYLKPGICGSGYYKVNLITKGKENKNAMIHRLVAKTFIPKPDYKVEVNHKDGNKLNNNVENLEWITREENINHSFRIGLNKGPRKLTDKQVKVIKDLYIMGEYTQEDLSRLFKVTGATISLIMSNKLKYLQ